MELLRTGREDQLAQLAVDNRRAVRTLTGRLWDADSVIRRRAARALAAVAESDPRLGTELIRRILWGLNDESGTHGGDAILGLEEIGRRTPAMMEEFIGPLVAYCWDDSLRASILEALVATAETRSDLVRPWLGAIQRWVRPESSRESAALAQLIKALAPGDS